MTVLSSVRQNIAAGPQYNHMDVNNQNYVGSRGLLPILSAARRFRPSLLLEPNYRRELRDLYNRIGSTAFTSRASHASHAGEVKEVPVGINSAFEQPHHSGLNSTSVDVTGNSLSHGRGIYGMDDFQGGFNLSQPNTSHMPNNATEEEMIQAAIEASKLESRESSSRRQFGPLNVYIMLKLSYNFYLYFFIPSKVSSSLCKILFRTHLMACFSKVNFTKKMKI